jgi:hypothetical protein
LQASPTITTAYTCLQTNKRKPGPLAEDQAGLRHTGSNAYFPGVYELKKKELHFTLPSTQLIELLMG